MSSRTPGRTGKLAIVPVTPDRWPDLERLFGARGACGGCWCMAWRLPHREYERGKGARNKRAFKRLVTSGDVPGLLAYIGDEPVGWCSVAPRSTFAFLERSRILKPLDEKPVWSVSCLFVLRPYRRRRISVKLLEAAVDFARRKGAPAIEGYPNDPTAPLPDTFAWTGLASAFERAGFVEVARRSSRRPIMRRTFRSQRKPSKQSRPRTN
jgi:GNAT superfamily N-acetyltransferase